MNTPFRLLAFFFFFSFISKQEFAQVTSDFENLNLKYWNGSSKPKGTSFKSGNAVFPNYFNSYWSGGWAYSRVTDSVTEGYTNMYAARTAKGYQSPIYLVGQQNSHIIISDSSATDTVNGFYVTNSTYAYYSMAKGDGFAKKFGGSTGNDPDWFKLTIRKYLNGTLALDSLEFYLADFRDADNAKDYIVKDWTWIDLSSLGKVDSLEFTLSSSDVGSWGMNTPAFFCLDQLKTKKNISNFDELNLWYWNGSEQPLGSSFASGDAIFPNKYQNYWSKGWAYSTVQDSTTPGYKNMYAARTGSGFASENYAIGQQGSKIILQGNALGKSVNGLYVTNTTYAYHSMKNGDTFAKKFGGISGNDPDWFKLTIRKYLNGSLGLDSVTFFLADFRDADNSKDYIVKDWVWVDLLPLGAADSLEFTISSSDVGMYGINTPTFFCIDNLKTGSIITQVNTVQTPVSIVTYPVPANDKLYISSPTTTIFMYDMYDMQGRKIQTSTLNNQPFIEISELKSGIYLLYLYHEFGASCSKFEKQ